MVNLIMSDGAYLPKKQAGLCKNKQNMNFGQGSLKKAVQMLKKSRASDIILYNRPFPLVSMRE